MNDKFVEVYEMTRIEMKNGAIGIGVRSIRLAVCDHMTVPPPTGIYPSGDDPLKKESLLDYFLQTHQIHSPIQYGCMEHGDTYYETWEKISPKLAENGVHQYLEYIEAPKSYQKEALAPLGWLKTLPTIGSTDQWKIAVRWTEDQCHIPGPTSIDLSSKEEAKDANHPSPDVADG